MNELLELDCEEHFVYLETWGLWPRYFVSCATQGPDPWGICHIRSISMV